MNYIRHLNAFLYHYAKNDDRLNSGHVSLYMALFQYWNFNRFQNPFYILRKDMMSISKIGSKNTYGKCLQELHDYGYIYYQQSPNKFHKSAVNIVQLDKGKEKQAINQLDLFSTEFDTDTVPDLIPEPPITNNVTCPIIDTGTGTDFDTGTVPNLGLLIKHKHIKQNSVFNTPTQIFNKNKKLQKKINALAGGQNPEHEKKDSPPFREGLGEGVTLSEVEGFFKENNLPITEAQKFYYYNNSKGWMLNKKTPITDWKSIARKWMLNVENSKPVSNGKSRKQQKPDIDTGPGKDYSEPL